MKKRIMAAMLVIFAVWLLAGCGCKHQWKPATCTEPQICSLCGLANGEPLAHRYDDATCTKPQTCYLCGHTNGQPAAHDYADATCTEPKTCNLCGHKSGDPAGHEYGDATCTSPMICDVCNATYGDPLPHDWKDATCTEPRTCTSCGLTEGEPAAHTFKEASCSTPETCTLCGETKGEALGHSWIDATCTEQKTCERCGTRTGMALGHTYERTVCVRCGNKEVETLDELVFYLNRNYRELNTAVGKVEGITYEITNHEGDLFAECDFELQIMSMLYSNERGYSISYLINYGNMLPYEDRIQAAVDVLDFEMELAELLEDLFPGKKFAIYFNKYGYRYPTIKVDYYNIKYLPVLNYKKNNSGVNGYGSTDLCGVYMDEYKLFAEGWLHSGWYSAEADKLYDDIKAACDYDLTFYYHSANFR